MLKFGILCSGKLGFEVLKQIIPNYNVSFILTENNSKEIISLANKKNIPLFSGNPRKNDTGYEFIKNYNIDIIASINYLFLIDKKIIEHPRILSFNFHGSLLPKYRGRTPHVWAIINGEKETGVTAHLIDKECDTGDIIKQIVVPIENDDTGADILEKYSKLYYPLFKEVITLITTKNLKVIPQNNDLASFFGKRTPEDGEINWNWKSNKIRNWIRAQAEPYPGAFTYYYGKKIIIDKVSINNSIINEEDNAGEIISLNPLTIKTGNGSIDIESIRTENCTFEIGKMFGNEDR